MRRQQQNEERGLPWCAGLPHGAIIFCSLPSSLTRPIMPATSRLWLARHAGSRVTSSNTPAPSPLIRQAPRPIMRPTARQRARKGTMIIRYCDHQLHIDLSFVQSNLINWRHGFWKCSDTLPRLGRTSNTGINLRIDCTTLLVWYWLVRLFRTVSLYRRITVLCNKQAANPLLTAPLTSLWQKVYRIKERRPQLLAGRSLLCRCFWGADKGKLVAAGHTSISYCEQYEPNKTRLFIY